MNTSTEPEEISTIRALARALGKSPAAVSTWARRSDWEFARGPWDATAVEAIAEWARRTLRPDYARQAAERKANRDGFWDEHEERPPIPVETQVLLDPADCLALPAPLLTDLERDVLTGKRTLTAEQVKTLVHESLRIKASMVVMTQWLPAWLVRHDEEEITKRMCSEVGLVLTCAGHRMQRKLG